MGKKDHYTTQFEPGAFHHVFNRTVGKELLFISDENQRFFLRQYDHYLSQFVETHAFCLLGNHFHLLIRVREEMAGPSTEVSSFDKLTTLDHAAISSQFRKFFQSYAMA